MLLEAQGMKEAWCDSQTGKKSADVYEKAAEDSQWKIMFATSAVSPCDDQLSAFMASFLKEGITTRQAYTTVEGNRWCTEASWT